MDKKSYLRIRLSGEDKTIIQTRAKRADMSMSEYLRSQGTRGKVLHRQDVAKLYVSINRIGNNINQAVKLMNTYHFADDEDTKFLYDELLRIKALVEEYIRG